MALQSKITVGQPLRTYVRYTNGSSLNETDVDSFWRNSTKTLSDKRLKPTDLLHSKTARSHSLQIRSDALISGQYSIKLWCKSVHQAANLSKDLALPLENESVNDLNNRLRNKLKGDGVNLGMALAEYNKTAKLFGELAGDVAKLYRAIKGKPPRKKRGASNGNGRKSPKGNPPRSLKDNADTASKEAASRTLQFNYGVTPLALDMVDSIKLMREAGLMLPVLQATVGRRIYGEKTTKTVFQPINEVTLRPEHTYSCLRVIRLTAIADIRWELMLSTLGQTGLTNPFALAYELVPFSFVLDWWINVGDVLASLDNALYFGNITVQSSEKKYWQKRSVVNGISGVFTEKSYKRSVPYTISPINTFAYKPSVNLRHILNGTALLRSLL